MTLLDQAVPLLTGDPTSKVAHILGNIELESEYKTDAQPMPRIIRESYLTSIVLSHELIHQCTKLLTAVLLNALSRFRKAISNAHLQWVALQGSREVER
jgi:hypothetical protein